MARDGSKRAVYCRRWALCRTVPPEAILEAILLLVDGFTPTTQTITLPNRTRDFNNVPMGPKRVRYPDKLIISGLGGVYDVYFAWQLVP